MQIRKALSATVFGLLSSCLLSANAQDAKTAQQQRMKTCNAEAGSKSLKGEERKTFMSACLKGESTQSDVTQTGAPLKPQQQKLKDCNQQAGAKGLKDEARKTFMSQCLKI